MGGKVAAGCRVLEIQVVRQVLFGHQPQSPTVGARLLLKGRYLAVVSAEALSQVLDEVTTHGRRHPFEVNDLALRAKVVQTVVEACRRRAVPVVELFEEVLGENSQEVFSRDFCSIEGGDLTGREFEETGQVLLYFGAL